MKRVKLIIMAIFAGMVMPSMFMYAHFISPQECDFSNQLGGLCMKNTYMACFGLGVFMDAVLVLSVCLFALLVQTNEWIK